MRMTLARKGLLAHVQVVKKEEEATEVWLFNDCVTGLHVGFNNHLRMYLIHTYPFMN